MDWDDVAAMKDALQIRDEDGVSASDLTGPTGRKNQAFLLVNDRMEFLENIAESALHDTREFIEDVQVLISNLEEVDLDDFNYEEIEYSIPDFYERPTIGEVDLTYNDPEGVEGIVLDNVPEIISDVEFPSYEDIEAPEYEKHYIDELISLGDIPEAPIIQDVDVPGSIDFDIPAAPSLSELYIPPVPEIFIPEFDDDFVLKAVDAPGEVTWGDTPSYSSEIEASLFKRVLDNLQNGGTGLLSEIEEKIFWNHTERSRVENESRYRKVESYYANRGFTMPTGLLLAKLDEVSREIQNSNISVSNDIAIKQAELAQTNTHFFVDIGYKIESMLREFYIKNTTMIFEKQATIAKTSVDLFNAKVAEANLSLEQYKTKASVWETRIRAAMSVVQLYSAQIEAVKAQGQIQALEIEKYKAILDATAKRVDIYTGQISAAKIKADIQRTIFEIYEAKIKAYVSKIEVNKAIIAEFEAKLRGEEVKASIYAKQVEALSSEISAKSKIVDSDIQKSQIIIAKNNSLIEKYKADVSRYETDMRAIQAIVSTKVDGYKAEVSAYEAETGRDSAYYSMKIDEIKLKISEADSKLKYAISKIDSTVKSYVSMNDLKITGMSGVMNVGAQLAAAAMQGISTHAGISYSGGDSYSASDSSSLQVSKIYQGSV